MHFSQLPASPAECIVILTKRLPTGVGKICDVLFEVLKYGVFGDSAVGG